VTPCAARSPAAGALPVNPLCGRRRPSSCSRRRKISSFARTPSRFIRQISSVSSSIPAFSQVSCLLGVRANNSYVANHPTRLLDRHSRVSSPRFKFCRISQLVAKLAPRISSDFRISADRSSRISQTSASRTIFPFSIFISALISWPPFVGQGKGVVIGWLTQSIASGTLTEDDLLSPPLYPARARGAQSGTISKLFCAPARNGGSSLLPLSVPFLREYRVSRDFKGSRSRGEVTPLSFRGITRLGHSQASRFAG